MYNYLTIDNVYYKRELFTMFAELCRRNKIFSFICNFYNEFTNVRGKYSFYGFFIGGIYKNLIKLRNDKN